MRHVKLTRPRWAASFLSYSQGSGRTMRSNRLIVAGALMMGTGGLGGCINVAAPDEPIVIELNINIRQEVVYRLAETADDAIEENADIF